jgi:nicotinamidase-related amidase
MNPMNVLDPRLAKVLNPKETAILVVDMMEGYCNPAEPLPDFLQKNLGFSFAELNGVADRIVDFLDASRKYHLASTVFIRMIERPETSPPNIRLKMEIEKYPPVVEKNGQGWDYFKVKPVYGDFEIVKYNYDAFMGTQLEAHLQEHGVRTVIIVGGHASVCVDTTARTAAQLGYQTFVPADLTADPELSAIVQTPKYIRKKLDTINSVMGYMPLAKSIIDVWNNIYS